MTQVFADKFVAFIDILGFTSLVEKAEQGEGLNEAAILEALAALGKGDERAKFAQYGPTTCPNSPYLSKDLDFEITKISDCAIISVELSPVALLALVDHCWVAQLNLLSMGLMCRGYITRGKIVHKGNTIFGSGYVAALAGEKTVGAFKRSSAERGTPFIELDSSLVEFINERGDDCVKKMFGRVSKSDGNLTALYPIQLLSHSFIVAGFGVKFDPQREKEANHNVRVGLMNYRKKILRFVDPGNAEAVQKSEHYLRMLDEQIAMCAHTDEMIDKLCQPIGGRRLASHLRKPSDPNG